MTKRGETDKYTASRHVEVIEHYLGRRADIVVCNTARPDAKILARYAEEGSYPVDVDLPDEKWDDRRVVKEDLLVAGDLVRHDYARLAEVLGQLIGVEERPRVATARGRR
ncbi:MAG: hypothetical protein UX17_C0070G0004 [Parcubacteria group bacterium GW2011_GWC2_45_7]|nr:MAG: hypothetical protein UX17_C0070G0004 [Parcubacteria group bacterium GW2011_GWC2_45_7]